MSVEYGFSEKWVLRQIKRLVRRAKAVLIVKGRKVVTSNSGRAILYLPKDYRELWEEIRESGKVDLIIIVRSEPEGEGG